ncbi:MAG: hypothetical protein CMF70_12445 [Magnetovibrio sp.]|nr:hypothetical protein [Magnetovibrio sp.]
MKQEGKISRWSRLKSKHRLGEASETTADSTSTQDIETSMTISGLRDQEFVPAMAPLAPEEEGDDRLSSGVGRNVSISTDKKNEVIGTKVLESQDQEGAPDFESLSPEEKEAVKELPPIEKLDADSDYTVFLKENVPDFLRRRALNALWRSNPLFGFLDGMNDYDEDYNVIDKILSAGDVSGYKIGQGFLEDGELEDMMTDEAKVAFSEDPQTKESDPQTKESDPQTKESDPQTKESDPQTKGSDVQIQDSASQKNEGSSKESIASLEAVAANHENDFQRNKKIQKKEKKT